MKGTVKFFDERKDYDFIETDGDEDDHFVPISNIEGNHILEEGDRVEFKSELDEEGFQALEVRKIDS